MPSKSCLYVELLPVGVWASPCWGKLTLGSGFVATSWPGMGKGWRVHGSYFFPQSLCQPLIFPLLPYEWKKQAIQRLGLALPGAPAKQKPLPQTPDEVCSALS